MNEDQKKTVNFEEKIPHKSRNRLIHEGLIKIGKITIEE